MISTKIHMVVLIISYIYKISKKSVIYCTNIFYRVYILTTVNFIIVSLDCYKVKFMAFKYT